MRTFLVALVALACVAASGCIGDAKTSINGNGTEDGTKTKALNCGAEGKVAVAINGQGKVTVSVTDGDDQEIYRGEFSGSGQQAETESIDGVAGKWTLRAQFSGTSFGGFTGGFQGQYSISLAC